MIKYWVDTDPVSRGLFPKSPDRFGSCIPHIGERIAGKFPQGFERPPVHKPAQYLRSADPDLEILVFQAGYEWPGSGRVPDLPKAGDCRGPYGGVGIVKCPDKERDRCGIPKPAEGEDNLHPDRPARIVKGGSQRPGSSRIAGFAQQCCSFFPFFYRCAVQPGSEPANVRHNASEPQCSQEYPDS